MTRATFSLGNLGSIELTVTDVKIGKTFAATLAEETEVQARSIAERLGARVRPTKTGLRIYLPLSYPVKTREVV
jgi:hypothetical protein